MQYTSILVGLCMLAAACGEEDTDGVAPQPTLSAPEILDSPHLAALTIEFDGNSWTVPVRPLVSERWVTTGNCERSMEYLYPTTDLDWIVALVPFGQGGGPFPMPAPGTDPAGYSDLTRFAPAFGPDAWISGGTVTVSGVDGKEDGGLRFEGGEVCTTAGCAPMGPFVVSSSKPWPPAALVETDTDSWTGFSGVEGPTGLPLCP
jgi:hypothetical protein